jgi:dipeptidyl aminopeptidase/acylaminoacyl peptidase
MPIMSKFFRVPATIFVLELLVLLVAVSARAAVPPLIDRELIFGDPDIAAAQLSPDGQYIAFLKPFNGTRNIWAKRTDESFDKARPLTADTKRPIPQFFWSRDGKYILFAQDNAGDENYNVYAVQPDAKPAAGRDVPEARNLTAAQGVRAVIYDLPKSDADIMFVGLNDRDKAWHDLYKVRISTGERTLLRKNTERIAAWEFDLKDELRLAVRTTDNGDTDILRVNADGFTRIFGCTVFESCSPSRFQQDGKHVYLLSNSGDADLMGLFLLDVESGQTQIIESDPDKRVDLAAALFSEVTDELIGTAYLDDKVRVYWRDKEREADYNLWKRKLGNKEIRTPSTTRDEQLVLISASSDIEPGEVYLFDRRTKQLTLQYRVREAIPRTSLAEMHSIRYKSSDDLAIPAYLSLPKGVTPKGLPLIVVPHGGPWARDIWGYNPLAQFFANRGFAVLQMNFRGSTGYGKNFLNAGNGEWGQKMQDDITWGVKHLVREGIADPKRVAIMGVSYGGYATLAGVAFTPELYQAAVSYVGPSNLITLLAAIPPYWEAGRRQMYTRMANPDTPEGRAKLERQSPLNSANKIRTPLMVIQGANDPRVSKRESDQIVVALRDRRFPVEYLVAPDEGHGFARPVNNMAAFASAEKFLAKHIAGVRFQPDMKPEVAERLRIISVDPNTVELTKLATATGAPTPTGALKPGVYNYKAVVDRGGQTLEMTTSTTIKDNGATISVIDTAKTPSGDAVDDGTYDKTTLRLVERKVTQGPVNIHYTLTEGKAQGELSMNGQSRPIAVELKGETFADGPGTGSVIATLPLAEGYSVAFRSFNVQTQQVMDLQLKVTGSETVSVPAGKFDCFKVEIESSNGGKNTAWIAKSPREVVRAFATGPQLGGATVTSELQP